MSNQYLSRLAVAVCLDVVAGAATAQALAVKPGGWNLHIVPTGVPGARPFDAKSCITKEELQSLRAFQKDDDCKYTVKSSTAARWAGSAVCDGKERGEFELVAKADDQIAMTISFTDGAGGKGALRRVETTGRWASASCKGFND